MPTLTQGVDQQVVLHLVHVHEVNLLTRERVILQVLDDRLGPSCDPVSSYSDYPERDDEPVGGVILSTHHLPLHVRLEEAVDSVLAAVEHCDTVAHGAVRRPVEVPLVRLQGLVGSPDDPYWPVSMPSREKLSQYTYP